MGTSVIALPCEHLTRWAPIVASAVGEAAAAAEESTTATEPGEPKHRRHVNRAPTSVATSVGLFSFWFAPKVEVRRSTRHRAAQR